MARFNRMRVMFALIFIPQGRARMPLFALAAAGCCLAAWSAWGHGSHAASETAARATERIQSPLAGQDVPPPPVAVKPVHSTEGSGASSNGLIARIDCDGNCAAAPDLMPRERHKRPDYVVEPPDVLSVTVSSEEAEPALLETINGEHLIEPDGSLNLGEELGHVQVGGMTLGELPTHVQDYLRTQVPDAQVLVSVASQNSKVYYIITDGDGGGDLVMRNPALGDETVRDALAHLPDVDWSEKSVWIARPLAGGSADELLAVNAAEVVDGIDTSTNYGLQPGDRIFVSGKSALWETLSGVLSSTWETLIEMFW